MTTNVSTDTAVNVTLRVIFRGRAPGENIGFSDIEMALLQLEIYWPFVVTLSVKLAGADVPARDLRTLLENRMPSLGKLVLQGVHPTTDVTDYLAVPFDHYNYDSFGPEKFSLPLIPECAHTEFDMDLPPASIPEFTYEDFLDALTRLPSLSHLELCDFLHVPTTTWDSIPSAAVTRTLPKLSTLIIHDIPSRIRFFLPYFMIPLNVYVQLFASCDERPLEGDILREMLPAYPGPDTLPKLGHIDRLMVLASPSVISLNGAVSPSQSRQDMIIISCGNTPTARDPDESRAQLLQSVVEHTLPDIFRASKLTHLSVHSDVVSNTDLNWASMLGPFQNLTALCIRDTAHVVHDPLNALFDALGKRTEETSPGSGQMWTLSPLCPRLRHLLLEAIRYPIREKAKEVDRNPSAVNIGPSNPVRPRGLRPLKAHNGSITNREGGRRSKVQAPPPEMSDPLFKALEWRAEAGYGLDSCKLVDVRNIVPGNELQTLVNYLAQVVDRVSLKDRLSEQTYRVPAV